MPAPSARALLPHSAPVSPDLRLVLYALRRMAAGGLNDAHAANAFLTRFGMHYRRPLVLVRTLVGEMSRAAQTRITVAPCCCPRVSASEHAILGALVSAERHPATAHAGLARLLKVRSCTAVLSTAQAVAACFADLGAPLPQQCLE